MPVIEVSHLTKEYRLGALQGLKQTVVNAGARLLGRPVQEPPLFKALDDVSFSIEQGEVVGIIGHNGAGKSTLLKMLARISTPTSGSVKVNGRIAPLIEVGAGFVPDFTGRENVYLNGAILGMSKAEIDRKFDEIVDFAEMAEFIDTPVKRYSSGMQVKLAFAVATSVESEILIVDEVLAVGDLAFQRKCFDRMEDLIRRQGRTVLIVSHNIRQIARLCSRTILLNHGQIVADGEPNRICDTFYRESNSAILNQYGTGNYSKSQTISTGEVDLLAIRLLDHKGRFVDSIQPSEQCVIECDFRVSRPLSNIEIVYGIHTTDFVYLSSLETTTQDSTLNLEIGFHTIACRISELPLMAGIYAIRIGVFDKLLTKIFYGENLKVFSISENYTQNHRPPIFRGIVKINGTWELSTNLRQFN